MEGKSGYGWLKCLVVEYGSRLPLPVPGRKTDSATPAFLNCRWSSLYCFDGQREGVATAGFRGAERPRRHPRSS
jgi:hypothetical protein